MDWILYLQVIVLDTRYHRDPLRSDGSILGDTQWAWLEEELRGPRSEITIIGSSVQVFCSSFFINPKPVLLRLGFVVLFHFGHELEEAECLIPP